MTPENLTGDHPGAKTLDPKRCPICSATIADSVLQDGRCGPGWILDDVLVPAHCSEYHYLKGCVLALQQKVKELRHANPT